LAAAAVVLEEWEDLAAAAAGLFAPLQQQSLEALAALAVVGVAVQFPETRMEVQVFLAVVGVGSMGT
jgi:hypothetical protein